MSIRSHVRNELLIAKVEPEVSEVVIKIVDLFLDEFNSGGAAHIGFGMINRLLAGKPLTPLTGVDAEWYEPMLGTLQNIRCASVFKCTEDIPHHGFKKGDCYDLDNFEINGKPFTIIFPYYPERAEIPSPIIEAIEKDDGPTAAK